MQTKVRWFGSLAVGFFIFVGALAARAEVQEFVAPSTIKVYSTASSKSKVLTELEKGDHVPISTKTFNGYRRVLVRIDGVKTMGYITSGVVTEKSTAGLTSQEKATATVYHHHIGVGPYVGIASLSQGSRTIQDQSGGTPVTVSELTGVSAYLGIALDFPISDQFALRLVGSMRRANLSGTTRISANVTQSVQVNQEMIGGGGFGKFYFNENGDIWIGAGFEVAKATNVTLVYANNTNVPVDESTYPTYFFVQAAAGVDFRVFGNFYLLPEIRAGVVANAQPSITIYEGLLTASYGF